MTIRHSKEWIEEIQKKARDIVSNTPDEKEARRLIENLADAYYLSDLYRGGLYSNAKDQLQVIEVKKQFSVLSAWIAEQRKRAREQEVAKDLFVSKLNDLIAETGVTVQVSASYCGEGVISINGFDIARDENEEGLDITF